MFGGVTPTNVGVQDLVAIELGWPGAAGNGPATAVGHRADSRGDTLTRVGAQRRRSPREASA